MQLMQLVDELLIRKISKMDIVFSMGKTVEML